MSQIHSTSLVLAGALSLALSVNAPPSASTWAKSFFQDRIGLTPDDISLITSGQPVVKLLPSRTSADIFVFSAVFIKANPSEYSKLILDPSTFRKIPGYLDMIQLSNPPKLSDLRGFTLEPEDIADLSNCRPGDCDVQLPTQAMQELNNLNTPPQVNAAIQKIAFETLLHYPAVGNRALGTYSDQDAPFNIENQLQLLLNQEALPLYLPKLKRYLVTNPKALPKDVESRYSWERVDFGMKTTLRLNHTIAFRAPELGDPAARVIAVKQLWASHYFQLALDLTAVLPSPNGFYLINVKGSVQQGLTGFKGALLRKIIVPKTLSAQKESLTYFKNILEQH